MRIAQVNVYFKPFMVGGAEWYVYNISRELVKRGHEVHVFTADRCGGKEAPASEVIEGITVHRLPLRLDLSYRLKLWEGLAGSLRKGGFDVVHAYDYAQPHSAAAIGAGSAGGSATVLTVFDVHSMIPRVWYRQVPMLGMELALAPWTLARAGKVLVRAPELVEAVVRLGAPRSRIVVTSSGVREESLGDFDGGGFREAHGIRGSPVVLFMGRLNPLKGPQHLVEAAPGLLARFPDAQFVFIGPDQAEYGDTLRSRAVSLGVSTHVHFLGPIYDFQEKMAAYASCDAFALPTSFEGTSQSIFEAMAQARPVVATTAGGVPSQLTDGQEGFLVPVGDHRALGDRLATVLADSAAAAEMGRKGKARVRAKTYPALATELEAIYAEARAAA